MTPLLQLLEPGQTPETHAEERKLAIGIDLGTTHSVAALVVAGHPVTLKLEGDSALIPSAVAYGAEICVGRKALALSGSLTSTKRLMGRGVKDPIIKEFPQVVEGSDMLRLQATEDKQVTPVEVSADILRHIRTQAEEALGEAVKHAVITVPAYFDDGARAATKDAARLAGLEVLRLINEPTAAALAYGLDREVEGIYAIYDFGGGTFDISLLKLEKGIFQVLATAGDLTLGGDDIDRALCLALDIPISPENIGAIRRAKEALSEVKKTTVTVGFKSHVLRTETLEKVSKPFIDRTLSIAGKALKDAGLKVQEVEGVVLVGGSTRLKAVRQAVEGYFKQPPLVDIDPDEAVALGAATQAYGLTEGADHLLLDVIPLSLGLETMGGVVEKIIHRNSPLPTTASQDFTTYQEGQTGLIVHVVQGEREFVDDCRSLARFELSGIPLLSAGAARIEIKFNVDADGLLTVTAQELTTGVSQHVEIKPSYGLTSEAMQQMIEESLIHGQEDMQQRLLEEARVKGRRLLQDVKTALETDGDILSAKEKSRILVCIQDLNEVLEVPDRKAILAHHESLEAVTQSFAERRLNRSMKSGLVGENTDFLEEGIARKA